MSCVIVQRASESTRTDGTRRVRAAVSRRRTTEERKNKNEKELRVEPTETKSMRNAVSRRRTGGHDYVLLCASDVQCCEYRNVTVLEPNGRPNTTDGDGVHGTYNAHYTRSLQSEVVCSMRARACALATVCACAVKDY